MADAINDDGFVRYDFFRPDIPAISALFSARIDVFNPPHRDESSIVSIEEIDL